MRPFGRKTGLRFMLGALVPLVGCDDSSTAPAGSVFALPSSAVIASDTVRTPGVSLDGDASGALGANLTGTVYVAIAPGAIARGSSVDILNLSSGSTLTVPLVEGGFDPVPVSARTGDALELVVRDGGVIVTRVRVTVSSRRPPRVVRTDPPRRKRDVALNATIVVVFSEPIDPASLTGTAVRVLRGSTPVTGRLEFLDEERLTVAFVPESPLAARATYTLAVTESIRDADGDPLEEAVSVTFETGDELTAVASISIDQSVATLAPGETAPLFATALDATGNALNVTVEWAATDPGVATVDAAGLVHGVALGTTTLTATAEDMSASTRIDVGQLEYTAVDPGGAHSCGLVAGGAIYCWGGNWSGQLGDGSTDSHGRTPRRIAGQSTYASISVGTGHACGLTESGEAHCWGSNPRGELGSFTSGVCGSAESMEPCSDVPVPVGGALRFTSISVGAGHTCAVGTDEFVYCWGWNLFGQLGTGTMDDSPTPVAVAGGLRFASVSAGEHLSCGTTTDGAAYCWGLGHWYGPPFTYSALGDGSPGGPELCGPPVYGGELLPCSTVPVAVAGGIEFTSIDAGWLHACGLDSGGKAYCWGEGPGNAAAAPAAVRDGFTHRGISAAYIEGQACTIAEDGQAFCWGLFFLGGALDHLSATYIDDPRPLPGDVRFRSIGTAWYHSCGLATDGAAYCWGANASGALGDGSVWVGREAPTKVAGQP